MKILAFETSAKAVSVALLSDGILLGEYYQNSGQTHSRTLMQMCEDLIRNSDLTEQDIDALAVAKGPGSFTGVRIGVSAAKGFSWGRELPCIGVSTLEGMAASHRHLSGVLCCCMDARRSQVYNALFRSNGEAYTRLCEDRAVSLEELKQDLSILSEPVYLIGDGAKLCYQTLGAELANLKLLPESIVQQRASGIAAVAEELLRSGFTEGGGQVTPNYLRMSQAERERNNKSNKQ